MKEAFARNIKTEQVQFYEYADGDELSVILHAAGTFQCNPADVRLMVVSEVKCLVLHTSPIRTEKAPVVDSANDDWEFDEHATTAINQDLSEKAGY